MLYALKLAENGRGAVEPNPMVGAVIVRDGVLVGEGYHQRYGEAHAEVHALQQAGDAARGATLYVTLEPCCHFGKTPPCTDAVLRSGVNRVVVAMADPFPAVAGGGLSILQQAGLTIEVGVCDVESKLLNAPYLKRLQTGRPYVIAKWAMTLDGKIAARTGHSQWISGPESRAIVHTIRGQVDGILVGRGTLLSDDPHLVARPAGPRTATRIILTRSGELPLACRLLDTVTEAPILIISGSTSDRELLNHWRNRGAEVLILSEFTIPVLLDELGRRRMTNLLVEGGSAILGAFFDAEAIDAVWVFIAPKLVGGDRAIGPISGTGLTAIPSLASLRNRRIEQIGDDVLITGTLHD